ncbi:hypothetical protein JS756_02975 [Streptomyces actuosus]|uniref:Uncharacterized protein n=1 Tax=Streptomyces actuosus TaxID=1885 RepID=A0ABS2VJ11_STRAS|nr:hypothetical protein [Streptomyces actuosus]MBN0043092.1 hypothetical protein [Streptomyces actuosus]
MTTATSDQRFASDECPASSACTTYTWCDVAGPHHDHISTGHAITDTTGREIIDSRVIFFSNTEPTVSIGESDFTPDEARDKAAELRALADRIDEHAEQAQVAAQVEAFVADLNARRVGADVHLTTFIDEATKLVRKWGDAKAFAAWFLTAIEERGAKAGER